MGQSAREIGDEVRCVRAANRARLQREAEAAAAQAGVEVADPADIKDPARRFDAYFERGAWTQDELFLQICGLRLTKRCCVVTGALMLSLTIAGVFFVRAWVQLLVAPLALSVGALTFIQALRFGLMQSQLETRRLHTLSEYVARPDFFRHVLWR
jgi:hypothetical protein